MNSVQESAKKLLLANRKQYRVTHPRIASAYFEAYMSDKGDRGLAIRFVEIPERCGIEMQARSPYDLLMIEKEMIAAKIIKHEIPFELNKVIKMSFGRRDGRDYIDGV